jgi:hypothetical protein
MTQFIKGDVQKWIGQYVAIRDLKKKLEEEQKAAIKEYTDLLLLLEGKLQAFFTATGQDSAPTGAGTAYLSTTYRASIADKQLFQDFIKQSAQWNLLDWKANAKAARAYIKEFKAPVPGVNLTGITKVRINRPGQKTDDDEQE